MRGVGSFQGLSEQSCTPAVHYRSGDTTPRAGLLLQPIRNFGEGAQRRAEDATLLYSLITRLRISHFGLGRRLGEFVRVRRVKLALARWPGRLTLRQIDRVIRRIHFEFPFGSCHQVNSASIAKEQERDRNVTDFELDATSWRIVSDELIRLITRNPSKLGQQLTSLASQRHGQVLGIVKPPPLPVGDKPCESIAKRGDSIVTAWGCHGRKIVSACHSSWSLLGWHDGSAGR